MEEGREESSAADGWGASWEGRSNGWPLGLVPAAPAPRVSAASTLLVSTPSITSFSSSDFDTESTRSFFPEKSTTLGSLIGIHASSQLAFMEDEIGSIEEEKVKAKHTSGNSRGCVWWSLLSCRGGLRDDTVDVSPSLAHFLDNERKQTSSQRQTSDDYVENTHDEEEQERGQGQEHEQDERFHCDEIVPHRSSPRNNVGVITRPSGPSLRLILQQPSPTSYLSTDCNVLSGHSQNHHIYRHPSPGHGRIHTVWPGLCSRLSTGVAN